MKRLVSELWIGGLLAGVVGSVAAQSATVYRCPNNEYTSQITAQEAKTRGCRTIEGAPITIVAPPRPRPVAGGAPPSAVARASDAKVDAGEQRTRDSDARKILESELRSEETKLAEMQKEFNNGEPERQGGERNYQKYLDRVAELKASITRKESDIEAIKRELAKQTQAQ